MLMGIKFLSGHIYGCLEKERHQGGGVMTCFEEALLGDSKCVVASNRSCFNDGRLLSIRFS